MAMTQSRTAPGSGTSGPPAMCMRRIQAELSDWLLDPPEGCCLEKFEPLMEWVIIMAGPESGAYGPSLYRDDTFRLSVKFSEGYPLEPPEVMFIPPSPVHVHIYSNGHICLDILSDQSRNGGWSPALTISKVCLSLRSMLASSTEKKRPPGDLEYCLRTRNRSPRETRWEFHDNAV